MRACRNRKLDQVPVLDRKTQLLSDLGISELIGLKWRGIHIDSITIEERYCRGDWSTPKTSASAATIDVAPEVIAGIERLKKLTVIVRAGTGTRHYKVVKAAEPDDLVFQLFCGILAKLLT